MTEGKPQYFQKAGKHLWPEKSGERALKSAQT